MRKRFVQQPDLGVVAIGEVKMPTNSRDELPPVLLALQAVFTNVKYNERIFNILENALTLGKAPNGRTGMDLWEIIVLAVVRQTLGTNYDRLHHIANYDRLLRGIMGVGQTNFREGKKYGLTTLKENIGMLDEQTIVAINEVVLEVGQGYLKKKQREQVKIKVDTYVLETNVHFPTDYNLLFDAAGKCIKISKHLCESTDMSGWRKADNWNKRIKSLFRACGQISRGGGKNRTQRLQEQTGKYLDVALMLEEKVSDTIRKLNKVVTSPIQMAQLLELDYFHRMLQKHIDLVDRRILKGQTIPSEEKLYSLFEPHTEWIVKGKAGVIAELGHNVLIATDEPGFIVHHRVIQAIKDVHLTVPVAETVKEIFGDRLASISYDKGFYSGPNKENVQKIIPLVVMPKRGKRNQVEYDQEHRPQFKALKNAHSAVESNINELEHHGLNRCPDKGFKNFKKYVAFGVLSYNLHKLGNLIAAERKKRKRKGRAVAA